MEIKNIKPLFCASLLSCISNTSFANVVQFFHSNDYTNPASFSLTKDMQILTGVLGNNIKVKFDGQVFGNNGEAFSNETYFLPYFAFAKRINSKWTWAVNVSQPISAAISFPADSVVAPLVTEDYFFATDINPLLSYQISDSLSIGAGPVLQDYQAEFDYVDNTLGYVVNRVKPHDNNWVWGWDIGLNWAINKTTSLSLAYFSKMNVQYRGSSIAGSQVNRNFKITDFPTPATIRFDLTKTFCEKWLASLTLFHTQWHDVHVATFVNSFPKNIDFPVYYNNTIAVGLYSHYQLNSDWGFMGLLVYDQAAAKGDRVTIGFPTSDIYGFRLGFDYAFNKEVLLNVKYGYFWANPIINHAIGLNVAGREPIRVNSVDLSLTYKV